METLSEYRTIPVDLVPDINPKLKVTGVLYFLDGHYLFRYPSLEGTKTKFVTATDVAAAFSQTEQDTGWLPAGIVRAGHCAHGFWFIYSTPEQKVDVQIGEEALTIPIPRTVLMGVGSKYYLWALKGKHFDPEDMAFRAPFPNVYPDGLICWGQNTQPAANAEKARTIWNLFFETPFNGDLSTEKSVSHPRDVRLALRELGKKNAYPQADLKPSGGSIGTFINQILEKS